MFVRQLVRAVNYPEKGNKGVSGGENTRKLFYYQQELMGKRDRKPQNLETCKSKTSQILFNFCTLF